MMIQFFKQVWHFLDIIFYFLGMLFVVIGLFNWNLIAGFIGLGIAFILSALLIELIPKGKGGE